MKNRTDIHRPSEIIPANYEYIFSYNGSTTCDGWPVPSFGINCEIDGRHKDKDGNIVNGKHTEDGICCIVGLRTIAKVKFADNGTTCQCSVCSTHFVYGDVWKHEPTGEYLHLGHNCASKYNLLADRSAWELKHSRLKQATAVEAEKARRKEEREKFLLNNPGLEKDLQTDHHIVKSIYENFKTSKYCSLTEKQIALVKKLADEVNNPAPKEPTPTIPAPEGRVEVQGTVLNLKAVDSSFGVVTKALIKLNNTFDGAKVYVTVPNSYSKIDRELEKDDNIIFKATFQRSDRDQFFAFGKRPTFVSLVGEKK